MQVKTYLKLSIAVALATIALKTAAWWVSDSVSLLSDALESIVGRMRQRSQHAAVRRQACFIGAGKPTFGRPGSRQLGALIETRPSGNRSCIDRIQTPSLIHLPAHNKLRPIS